MDSKLRAIVFDAYGTLFDINSLDELLAVHFSKRSGKISAMWRRKQLEYTWLRTMMHRYRDFSQVTMDALAYSCQAHAVNLDEDLRQQLFEEYLVLAAYPEVAGLLQQLSSNVLLGILSNANHAMLEGALRRNELNDMFDHVLSADDVKRFKPRPEVYQQAVDKFKFDPEEILFVSSNTWDVAGAKSFGLKVAWLNRSGAIMERLGFQPDHTLDHMGQLLGVMGYKL